MGGGGRLRVWRGRSPLHPSVDETLIIHYNNKLQGSIFGLVLVEGAVVEMQKSNGMA